MLGVKFLFVDRFSKFLWHFLRLWTAKGWYYHILLDMLQKMVKCKKAVSKGWCKDSRHARAWWISRIDLSPCRQRKIMIWSIFFITTYLFGHPIPKQLFKPCAITFTNWEPLKLINQQSLHHLCLDGSCHFCNGLFVDRTALKYLYFFYVTKQQTQFEHKLVCSEPWWL